MFSPGQVHMQGSNGTYVIDVADSLCSNWLRFVNSPTKVSEENVIPVSCEGIIFYMTHVMWSLELNCWCGTETPTGDFSGSTEFIQVTISRKSKYQRS